MTNTTLQSFFDQFPGRVCAIIFDEHVTLFVDYKMENSPTKDDIELVTIGGIDFVKVNKTDPQNGKEVKYASYLVTEHIQSIMVMDEEFKHHRVDPLRFR